MLALERILSAAALTRAEVSVPMNVITERGAAVKIEGNPCLERFQADLYGKSQLNQ